MIKIISLLILLFQFTTFANELERTGSVEGKVMEYSTTQPLSGANVVIKGTTIGASADAEGKYRIENIPAGSYSIEASMIGYETKLEIEVIISANRVTTMNFELRPTSIELNEEVRVIAGFFDVDPEKSTSTKKLSAMEIKSSPGSGEDVFRVIKTIPGITASNAANANLIVRGGSPDENLTLLDNIEIYSPLHFGKVDASMGIISIINPDMLETAEFSSGGFPAEFGGKISSLFELKLKEGNSRNFNTDFNINMAGFGVYTDGPINENSNLIFSVRRGIFDLITKMMKRDAAPSFWDIAGKVTYNIGTKNKISLVGFYYKDDMEKNSVDSTSHMEDGRKYQYVKRSGYGSATGLNWKYLFSNKGFSLTTLSYTGNGWDGHMGDGIRNDLKGEDLLEKEISVKNETVFKINNHIELKGGLFYKSISTDHFAWYEEEELRTGEVIPADTIDYNPPQSYKGGAFFQSTFKPLEKLFFTAGLRYDYYELTSENNISPRLSASYKISNRTALNFSIGKYYQDPSPYQMQLSNDKNSLNSSQAIQYVFGAESILRDDIKVSAEVYYKDLSRTFVYYDAERVFSNSGSGYVKGIEFFLQKKMIDDFVGSISYTYSISKRRDNDGLPLYYFEYDRAHNLNLVGSYRISENWQVGLKYTYATGMPYTPAVGVKRENETHIILYGDKNSSRFPDYHELDVRIDRKFYFNNWTLCIYLDLWNVYNHENIVDYTFNVDDKGTISKTPAVDFKIMPILGINAQL